VSGKTMSCVPERIYECILGLFVEKVRRSLFREEAVVVLGVIIHSIQARLLFNAVGKYTYEGER
jgi:hypothetical protein